MTGFLYAATLGTALACGLVAGVFFAFSTFVMPALGDLPPAQGIAAMQSVNRAAITPAFMAALFLPVLGCAGLAVWALVSWGDRPAPWVLAGAALYVIGTVVVTIARNVPLNDALEKLDPNAADAAGRWSSYIAKWTAWNHFRGAAALVAAALLTVALATA